jgi:hypothetical protein
MYRKYALRSLRVEAGIFLMKFLCLLLYFISPNDGNEPSSKGIISGAIIQIYKNLNKKAPQSVLQREACETDCSI